MIWDMVVDEEAVEVGVDVEDAVVEEEEEMEDVESFNNYSSAQNPHQQRNGSADGEDGSAQDQKQ